MLEMWNKEYFTEVGDACKFREVQLRGVTEIASTSSFIIRVDGRAFHTFTGGMPRPFCAELKYAMSCAAQEVMKQLGAQFVYFQSDEITYVWKGSSAEGYQHPFGGRVEKLLSVVASLTSVAFYRACEDSIVDVKKRPLPHFDARLAEIADVENNLNHDTALLKSVMWRENDAIRNAIAMVAQSYYSQTELHGKNVIEQRLMCTMKGYDWDASTNLPFLQGTYLIKRPVMITLTDAELAKIPEHRRPDPGHTFSRSTIVQQFFDTWDIKERADYLLGDN